MSGADGFIAVVAAVVVHEGRVLLCQRHDGDHLPLMWEFPGGKIDPGETPESALERELREELAVASRVGEQLAEVRHVYPDKRVWLRFYRASLIGRPRAVVHRELAWVTLDEIDAYPVPPPNAVVVGALVSGELHIH